MPRRRKQKEIAYRIDPTYYRRPHPARTLKRGLSWGCFALAALWIVLAWGGDDRTIYANGPVSEAHAQFEADCAQCHTEEWSSVPDRACIECHRVEPHVRDPAEGADPACSTCHLEHRGRAVLQRVSDGRCNECHESHAIDDEPITSLANHGPFDLEAREQHLRFDHAQHLIPVRRRDEAGGRTWIDCAHCHEPEEGAGTGFRPIEFERHCRECHHLGLTIDRPERRLPHGIQPDEVAYWVQAFYLLERRADPGWTPPRDPEEQAEHLLDPANRDGCLLCHETGEGNGAPTIRRPEIPRSWLDRARFDHRPHRFVWETRLADLRRRIEADPRNESLFAELRQVCMPCHDMSGRVRAGETTPRLPAQELVLPQVESCRECHHPGGSRAACATCHAFHGTIPEDDSR